MDKNIADVSVVVANYNNGKYVSRFLSSVAVSSFLPKELIIVDDGSVDDSVSVIEAFSRDADYLKLIKFASNRGFAHALNQGLRSATGKYIMRVDPDDYISPKRIEAQYKFLENNPGVDILGSNIEYFDSAQGNIIFSSNTPPGHEGILREFKNGNCGIIHGSMMCRRLAIGQFVYEQGNVPAEDYELFSRMLKVGCVAGNLPEVLTFVRIHSNSISNSLPFDTIQKTFRLKHEIWGTKTSYFAVRRIHLYLYYYRRFLFCKGWKRYVFLFYAALLNPRKVIARITF